MLVDTNFSNFFSDFLKRKQLFGIVETYFSISFIRLVKIVFYLVKTVFFLVRAILLLAEAIIGIRRKQF